MRAECARQTVQPADLTGRAVVAVPRDFGRLIGIAPADVLTGMVGVREFDDLPPGPGEFGDVVAVVSGDHEVTAATLQAMPRLRVISVDGTGVWDRVDVAAATARGVAVCNVRDYAADAVAEFTLGAIIGLARRFPAAVASVRSGEWDPDRFIGSQLRGRTLGLVGFGSIGARVAVLAKALGLVVLCTTARPYAHRAPEVQFVDLGELLARSDIVSLHAGLDDTTRGLIGAAELARLRPGALLVNTARGGLINHDALLAALQSGRLAGAALDVTDPEPLPGDSALRGLPSVVITPHIAAATTEAQRAAVLGCLRNIALFLDGRPASVVNPKVLHQR